MDARLVPLLLTLATLSTVPAGARGQRVADLTPSAAPHRGSLVGVTVVSAIFGGLGAIGGAYMGAGMGPGGDEALGSAIRGALFGAWAGAGLGGTVVSRRPGRAFLGSAVGLLPAVAILREADDGRGALLGSIVQGAVTALVTHVGS